MKFPFLLLFCLVQWVSPAAAIEFVTPTQTRLQWQSDLPEGGCIAANSGAPHELVFVGSCVDKLPHGRGILLADRQLMFVKFNAGREFERAANWQDPSVGAYRAAAEYQLAYHSIFWTYGAFKGVPGPNDTPASLAATAFLNRYGAQASQAHREAAQQGAADAQAQALKAATALVRGAASMQTTAEFLRKWPVGEGLATAALHAEATTLLTQRQTQERLAAEAAQRREADAARQRNAEEANRVAARNKLALTVCNNFYAGMVAKYERGGLFSTADGYVVRYVNGQRRTVTIEGTDSGNSLKYGQIVELSCIDLWEKTK